MWLRSVAIGLLASASHACLACDESLCESRVGIGIRMTENRGLAPGVWTFTFVADEDVSITKMCTVSEDSHAVHCDDGEGGISAVIFDDEDNPYTRFLLPLGEGDDDGDEVTELPETLDIHIEIDGVTVHDRRHEPDYELVEPRRCDPNCRFASVDVVIDER